MKIILDSRADLEEAVQLISWLNRPTIDQVVVSIPWLDRNDQKRSEKFLKRLFNDCGCQWGAPTFLITIILSSLTVLREIGITWYTMGLSFLISVCIAFVAKLLSLAWSCWRLKKWFKSTIERTNERERFIKEANYGRLH
jgi:hypothetical protein